VWVSAAGLYFGIRVTEWFAVLFCFALVISMEMLNHAIENVCDSIHTDHHPLIKRAKDVAAAAVLWSAIIRAVIGLIIILRRE
jgi:diacylglycerol kinase